MTAEQSIGGGQYAVIVDGVKFCCINDRIVTVMTGDERDAVG
ncbi:hypothetical protein [Methylocystis sp. H4A]|nr:hypothetical protein [Methylocystis sp. H4A]